MKNDKNHNLDALLRRWASERDASGPELDQLTEKIAAVVSDDRFLELPSAPRRLERRWLRPALAGFCGGLAASLLLCAWLLRPVLPAAGEISAEEPKTVAGPASLALWKPAEIAEKQRLFAAVDSEFGGHLVWLAEDGDDVSLRIAGPQQQPRGGPLAIRIVMLGRSSHGDSQWRQVWSSDVVTHSEQVIDALPGASAASVWAYALPDGLISIDSDVRLESPFQARVRFSGLFQSGIPGQVFSLETAAEEYRIYQTVVPLPGDSA